MPSLFSSSSWALSKIPDLSRKVFLVTGGTAGIGFGIVTQLLKKHPARIVLLSDKELHADLAQAELQKYGDSSRVEWVKCDLRDLKEVDRTAKALREKEKRLDCLVANAGIGVGVYNLSKDGIGMASLASWNLYKSDADRVDLRHPLPGQPSLADAPDPDSSPEPCPDSENQ